MFELYPAIDIHQGRCVRLTQGDYATANVYDESPANAARRWVAAGATQLHVVDLDGAKTGYPVNLEAIAAITAESAGTAITGIAAVGIGTRGCAQAALGHAKHLVHQPRQLHREVALAQRRAAQVQVRDTARVPQ